MFVANCVQGACCNGCKETQRRLCPPCPNADAGIVGALTEVIARGPSPPAAAAIDVLLQLALHHRRMHLGDDSPAWEVWGSVSLAAAVISVGKVSLEQGVLQMLQAMLTC